MNTFHKYKKRENGYFGRICNWRYPNKRHLMWKNWKYSVLYTVARLCLHFNLNILVFLFHYEIMFKNILNTEFSKLQINCTSIIKYQRIIENVYRWILKKLLSLHCLVDGALTSGQKSSGFKIQYQAWVLEGVEFHFKVACLSQVQIMTTRAHTPWNRKCFDLILTGLNQFHGCTFNFMPNQNNLSPSISYLRGQCHLFRRGWVFPFSTRS